MAVGWVGEGRDRLKLSQGDDVDENVPLQKGAPKRSWRRDLESTKGFVLEADLQAGSGVGGWGVWGGGSSRQRKDTRPEKAREMLYTSESDAFLSMCSLITLSRKASQPASQPATIVSLLFCSLHFERRVSERVFQWFERSLECRGTMVLFSHG